jgi:hypothetical protein
VQSIKRALLVPFRMLAQPQDAPPGSPDAVRNQASTLVQLAVGLGVLYALPFILRRRQPGLLLWGVCLACTVGLILGMDLARQTCHLSFIRYVLLAGPPVYVLIPATAAAFRPPWLRHLLPAAAMGASLLAINQGYHLGSNEPADAHTICNYIRRAAQPRDFFIFLATGDSQWQVFATYPVLARYLRPFPGPIAFENTWLSPPVLRQAMARRRVFVAAAGEDARLFLPQLTCVGYASYYGDCDLWVMAHPRSQPHPEPHPEPQTQLH